MEEHDRVWVLAPNDQFSVVYLFGDAEIIENIHTFVKDIQEQDRCITNSTANLQSEIFLEALTVVKDLPGDWPLTTGILC